MKTKRLLTTCSFLVFIWILSFAEKPFAIRGVLPWHNFLSGPSTWDETDYRQYLDKCQAAGINFIGFHNYTGGGERYAPYVEPMIKISYKGIIPEAYFDHSLSARWGYLPMKVSDFAYETNQLFPLPPNAVREAFGSKGAVTSVFAEDHYQSAQSLMKNVLTMAHERGIKMAMGFEFGVIPPEYFSLNDGIESFFWPGQMNMIPNPTHQTSIEIHQAAIDNILDTYPDIDYIWLWLNEHSFMQVSMDAVTKSRTFGKLFEEKKIFFPESEKEEEKFVGVWAYEYIRLTHDYLKKRNSTAKLIIGGWGGGNQLPALMRGLDKILPKEIVFSCLNPGLGQERQPAFLSEIAKNRETWAIPWLEGDHQLWHFQPRVNSMKEQVKYAYEQQLQGVVAIHWRTEEVRFNFNTFAQTARNPEDKRTVEQLYTEYLSAEIGEDAAHEISPLLAKMDKENIQKGVLSMEYFMLNPRWGLMTADNLTLHKEIVSTCEKHISILSGSKKKLLQRLSDMFLFEILLHDAQTAMQQAYEIRQSEVETGKSHTQEEYKRGLAALESAPVEKMFVVFARKVNSKGELGVLSSLNQKFYSEHMRLKRYLEDRIQ